MKYSIILTNASLRDLKNINTFIAKDNPLIAKEYINKILDRLKNLETFPFIGKKIHNPIFDYLKCFYLICLNYVAMYQINETAKCIYIVRILSHSQNWQKLINKEIINIRKVIISNESISIAYMNDTMSGDVWKNSLDDNNRKYVPDEVFESLQEAYEVVENIVESYNSKDGPFVYAVIRNEDNANMGYVQLVKIEEGWEVGYHIAERYTGHGYATEALSLFINYLKQTTDIKELYGIALASNKASRRVLEKNGFELFFEGTGLYQGKKRKIIKTIKRI